MEQVTPLCSPVLAARVPGDLATLVSAADLLHVRVDGQGRHQIWELAARAMGRPDVAVDRGLVVDTAQMAAQYALSGDGLALLDANLFRDQLADGRLMRPFDFTLDTGFGYYLTTSLEDIDNEAVALFRTWLIGRFANRQIATSDPRQDI